MIAEDAKKIKGNQNLSIPNSDNFLNLGTAIQDHKPMLFC